MERPRKGQYEAQELHCCISCSYTPLSRSLSFVSSQRSKVDRKSDLQRSMSTVSHSKYYQDISVLEVTNFY